MDALTSYIEQRKKDIELNGISAAQTTPVINEAGQVVVPDDVKLKAMAKLAGRVKMVMEKVETGSVSPQAPQQFTPPQINIHQSESQFGAPLTQNQRPIVEMPERDSDFDAMMARQTAKLLSETRNQMKAPVNYTQAAPQMQAPQSFDPSLINEMIDKRMLSVVSMMKEMGKEVLKDIVLELYTEEKIRAVVKDYLISLQKSKK
jgi:hypothetical protein